MRVEPNEVPDRTIKADVEELPRGSAIFRYSDGLSVGFSPKEYAKIIAAKRGDYEDLPHEHVRLAFRGDVERAKALGLLGTVMRESIAAVVDGLVDAKVPEDGIGDKATVYLKLEAFRRLPSIGDAAGRHLSPAKAAATALYSVLRALEGGTVRWTGRKFERAA